MEQETGFDVLLTPSENAMVDKILDQAESLSEGRILFLLSLVVGREIMQRTSDLMEANLIVMPLPDRFDAQGRLQWAMKWSD